MRLKPLHSSVVTQSTESLSTSVISWRHSEFRSSKRNTHTGVPSEMSMGSGINTAHIANGCHKPAEGTDSGFINRV
jgi:hypothetical protein